MPVQTSIKDYIYFPDGAKVSVKASGEVSYTDIGAINSAIECTLNYDENQIETANAGKLNKQIRNQTIEGSFTLINLDPENIVRLSGGMFTQVDTAASPLSTIPDQTIAAGWDDQIKYELVLETSSSDSTKLKTTTAPVLTSVTLDPTGTPEILVANSEYVIVADESSYSGWSIQFISSNMATGSPKTFEIVIDYDTNTPVASSTIHAGSSTVELNPIAIKFTHTDSAGLDRELEIHSADVSSGGFVFSFKGANEDGLEEMPISFMGKIDDNLTDGRQLFSYSVDNGAQ